ncbi:hypothetical protein GCM10009641_53840 [Mycobacterium cookii]|uniref:Uncharacterized protein n=1 Tax=Mycobacterium cookii TaxID=1775 RepID=A0A7I7KRL6_9MYCO|nr:hypothetical protein [Mycobacterium cookii]MCV7332378.1 hypothetical protein [Mycobacterium cookii]BBX44404.1 hypothetical protein MCOO_04190 [Mycobacterium cookii]
MHTTLMHGEVSVDVHHLGGAVKLWCSTAHHHIGHLRQKSNSTVIEYWPREGAKQPWPPRDEWGSVRWWAVRCPDGCPHEFGGPVDIILRIVNEVGGDPTRTEGEYTLIRGNA